MKKTVFNIIVYVMLFLILQMLVGVIIKTVWQMVTGGTDVTTTQLVVSMAIFNALIIAIFWLAGWTAVSARWLLTRQWLVLLWAVIAALGMLIPMTWLQEHMPELPNLIENEQELLMGNYWGYLVIGLMAPLAEEFVFRGAILRTLLGWDTTTTHHPSHPISPPLGRDRGWVSPILAIIISALLFAIVHLNPAQMPYAFIAGLLLGWMYWRTGSILPGMAYHWANNSAAYIVYHAYPDPDLKLIDIFQGSETHVLMAVFFSLLILLPALFQLHVWMRRAA